MFTLRHVIVFVCFFNVIETNPTVVTTLGQIKGSILTSDNGNPFYAFRGIPYAKPPVKELRFKPPEPVDKWNDTFDSTEDGHACLQFDVIQNLVTGDENCLYLNVYTSQLTKSKLRPVMVFIHGGGFAYGEGSSHLYGPERMLDKNIVLVTINYRLSALGFLSTEDAESPGNYGLLDQVEALKWIQKHVENFGGDPKSVTIFGESAGSASVIYHLISPLSKGLFHGAICQSGTATNIWAIHSNPLKQTKLLAESLNCPTNDSGKLVNCLRKRAALDVMIKSSAIEFANPMITEPNMLQFLPVVDRGFGKTEFLREHPESLFKKHQFNKVPVIFGNVKDEGFLELLVFSLKFGGIENYTSENIMKTFSKPSFYPENNILLKKLTNAFKYFTDVSSFDLLQRIQAFSDIFGDLFMNSDLDVTVGVLASSGVPTYAYKLTYHGENSIAYLYSQYFKDDYSKKLKLVSHTDDLQYLFRMPWFLNELNEQDKKMADKIITLWTNFAKNKVPTLENSSVEWKPVQPNQQTQYLNIGHELLMEEGTFSTKPHLWKQFQEKTEL